MNTIVNIYMYTNTHARTHTFEHTQMPLREMMAYNAQHKRVRFAIVSEKYKERHTILHARIQKQANMQRAFPETHISTIYRPRKPTKRSN